MPTSASSAALSAAASVPSLAALPVPPAPAVPAAAGDATAGVSTAPGAAPAALPDVVAFDQEVPLISLKLQGARLHMGISGDAFAGALELLI